MGAAGAGTAPRVDTPKPKENTVDTNTNQKASP